MSFADTKWGGFAKIIVDTSTMVVGDTVRVKSMTTGTNYDRQVVTVGTPLIWETDIYKDYVKICMVQTINDTPTEVGGVYRELDYGETAYINVLDKTTLGGIQGILNAHQETILLAIGDESTITLNGSPWVMQVGRIDGTNHKVDLVSKYVYASSKFNNNSTGQNYSTSTVIRPNVQAIYSAISENDRAYIKEVTRECMAKAGTFVTYADKIWIPTTKEVFNTYPTSTTPTTPQTQFPIFTSQAGRIKTDSNGSAKAWWTSDHAYNTSYCIATTAYGNISTGDFYEDNANPYILPCFTLTADS